MPQPRRAQLPAELLQRVVQLVKVQPPPATLVPRGAPAAQQATVERAAPQGRLAALLAPSAWQAVPTQPPGAPMVEQAEQQERLAALPVRSAWPAVLPVQSEWPALHPAP